MSDSDLAAAHARIESLERRLEDLEVHIAATRRSTADVVDPLHGPSLADSGSIHPELDDQCIAPG